MKYYVVDAFTDVVFHGNPAGVCVLDEWLPDDIMQNIAAENNLSETAFVVKRSGYYDLRWFTPKVEVDLCGHATLGTSYVVSHFIEPGTEKIEFHTNSGTLTIACEGERFVMDFPTRIPQPIPLPEHLEDILGAKPLETLLSRDLLVLLESEEQVRNLQPDFDAMMKLPRGEGVIVTAKGRKTDFVSRCFYPKFGIREDPVTGSAHCNLIPYWAKKLNLTKMTAAQVSPRGGLLGCELCGERVKVGGKAALYLTGEIVPKLK